MPSFNQAINLPSATRTSLLTLTKRTLIGIDILVLVVPSIVFAIWSSILLYDTIKIDNSLLIKNSKNYSDPFSVIIDENNNSSSIFNSTAVFANQDTGSYVPLIFQCLTFSILFGLTIADWLNVLIVSFGGEICERFALWRWKQKKIKENPSLVFSEETNERAEMEDAATDANIPPINEHWIDEDDTCEMAQTTCLAHGGFIIVKWIIMGGIILGLFSWFTYELLTTNNRLKGGKSILSGHDNNTIIGNPAVGSLDSTSAYWINSQLATPLNTTTNTTMDACATLFFTPVGTKSGSSFLMQRSKISSFGDSVFIYMLVRWLIFGLSLLISISVSILVACFGCCTCFSEKNNKKRKSNRIGENVIYRPLSTLSDEEDD
ncbi:predicted protein [Naegleria gruberi]|uniref:Predicted protein n=1 Tax=Naegleria gruberi TaxID=5762 RepID=D2VLT5_NAEGR|nr:uncharacterized protein NAEGRDRAFT_69893 [Naegleria gruberi]EFC42110.1 predicted protein [Naegleria gruberi]|eukprot:XP_002674854.1 predicted protein [Naegleria gruberi strain NEG-M]